ncbi:Xaa-Pro aminopeptidase [Granulibacter bethesdensis]|uniref:Xaa-Pro aminopeptidase n=1 Tax=Granulibacter bethesdensis TaxID=364410 RepID=A0AAC9P9H2_9PROT|nr:aminopeptidase P family protein [Granulibacter bethesdensis]APH55517.1 Xaa-Pro aminopeptidase [Granulibacter bethesdensis]APH63104.1 Xaa-Pro aminopeptidase [Granulibacter bethesdensis]
MATLGTEQNGQAASRLAAFRAVIEGQALDGFIIPRADEHLGEYVPACAERLAFLTGFTGSAGLAVVLQQRAALFTDGRYTLQATQETDSSLWEQCHIIETPPPLWLVSAAGRGARIGYDPLLISEDGLGRFTAAGLDMVPVAANPVDAVWPDRPAPPLAPAVPHPLERAGQDSASRRAEIGHALVESGEDAVVLTDPASLAWLLNIRGQDVPFTPYALGFAVLFADGKVTLFMAPEKIPAATAQWLGADVTLRSRTELEAGLKALGGRIVRLDPATAPVWFAQVLRQAGAVLSPGADPCALPRACKNKVEQAGARRAHQRDAVALCRFLYSLNPLREGETEASAAARLLAFRQEAEEFRGESFPAISGAAEHGAVIHYRVTAETDRPLRPNEVYLIDSGGQYLDGTTDVTRTIWIGPDAPPALLRDRFTRVLKGHIAVATLQFPQGVAGPHIDAMARRSLWDVGLDYDHGTGHGVGSYLSVHEGPASISRAARPVALCPGMILSDEPGYYQPGEYGIRLENLLLVQSRDIPDATRPFLGFETLTLAPFDRTLIEPDLLTEAEKVWLDTYHARVLAEIGPLLPPAEQAWLEAACAPFFREV